MSTRLTASVKRDIAQNARKLSPFTKELNELLEERKEIIEGIRIEALGGKTAAAKYDDIDKQLQALIKTLPLELMSHSSGIYRSSSIYVSLDGEYSNHYLLHSSKVVPSNRYVLPVTSPFHAALVASNEAESKLLRQLREVEGQVLASINSITTVKKLLDTWEEARELLPPYLLQPKVHLPALQTNKLNKLIGLPTKKGK